MTDNKNSKEQAASDEDLKEETTVKEPEEKNSKDKRDFKDKVSDYANKSLQVLKIGVQKLAHFTGSATKLSKLKVEIHTLQTNCDKIYLDVGKKLWQLHKDDKLRELGTAFEEEFKKIEDFHQQITAKQKEADKISLTE